MTKKLDHGERHIQGAGSVLRDIILGGQDGLVNVLGIVLGVATATYTNPALTQHATQIVLIAGLAATFAESISMAAVAYTSMRAVEDYYNSELEREKREMEELPEREKKEIRDIYYKKGFGGKELEMVVKRITSNKRVWLETMMAEELHLFKEGKANPQKSAIIVGLSAILGSLVPLIPFFFLPIAPAMITAIIISAVTLFAAGVVKAKVTIGSAGRSGLEMMIVGMVAAIAGYLIGAFLGASSLLA